MDDILTDLKTDRYLVICVCLLCTLCLAYELNIDGGLFLSYYQVKNDNNVYTGRYNANAGIKVYSIQPLYLRLNGSIYSCGSKESEPDDIDVYYLNSSLGVVCIETEYFELMPSISYSYYGYDIYGLNHDILILSPLCNIYLDNTQSNILSIQIALGYHNNISYGAEMSYSYLYTDSIGIKLNLFHSSYDETITTSAISVSVSYYK